MAGRGCLGAVWTGAICRSRGGGLGSGGRGRVIVLGGFARGGGGGRWLAGLVVGLEICGGGVCGIVHVRASHCGEDGTYDRRAWRKLLA
jgi:hypothetical protein